MSTKAAEELGIELKDLENNNIDNENFNLTVLADKGYYVYEDLNDCLNAGIRPIVAKQKSPNPTGNEKYVIDNFIYDKEKDIYTCPEGQILENLSKNKNTKSHSYKNKLACRECLFKNQCTNNKDGRKIVRKEQHDIYDIANKIMSDNKDLYKLKQMLVEHVFGTVKRGLGYTYFLTRGNESVRAESFMHFFIYNLKRVINIKGVRTLIDYFKLLISLFFDSKVKLNYSKTL